MKRHLALLLLTFFIPFLVAAQPKKDDNNLKKLTQEDYARAQRLMDRKLNDLITGRINSSGWTKDNRFWYNTNIPEGHRFVIVDPNEGTKGSLFNHEKLAEALSEKEEKEIEPFGLPFRRIRFSDEGKKIFFSSYSYNLETDE